MVITLTERHNTACVRTQPNPQDGLEPGPCALPHLIAVRGWTLLRNSAAKPLDKQWRGTDIAYSKGDSPF